MKKVLLQTLLIPVFALTLSSNAGAEDIATCVDMNNQGVKFLTENNYARAEERFISALKLDPSYDRARKNLGIAFNNHGLDKAKKHDPLTAIRLFHQAYLSDPTNQITRNNIAGMFKMFDLDSAIPADHIKMGDYFFAQNEYLSALAEYEFAESMGNEAIRQRIVDTYNKCETDSAFVKIHLHTFGKLRGLIQLAKDGKLSPSPEPGTADNTTEIAQKIFTAAITLRMGSAWREASQPALKQVKKKCKVVANVEVENKIAITSAKIATSSGSAMLDNAALKVIKASSPLQQLPPIAGVPARVQIALTFDFDPESRLQKTK